MTPDDLLNAGFVDATYLLDTAIYILFQDDVCVYVGQSSRVSARIKQHRDGGLFEFNRVLVRPVPKKYASIEEARTIALLKPKNNVQGKVPNRIPRRWARDEAKHCLDQLRSGSFPTELTKLRTEQKLYEIACQHPELISRIMSERVNGHLRRRL